MVVSHVGRSGTEAPRASVHVGQRHRQNRRMHGNGRLHQIAMEGQQLFAIARGAFREHGDQVTRPQAFGHVMDHSHGITWPGPP